MEHFASQSSKLQDVTDEMKSLTVNASLRHERDVNDEQKGSFSLTEKLAQASELEAPHNFTFKNSFQCENTNELSISDGLDDEAVSNFVAESDEKNLVQSKDDSPRPNAPASVILTNLLDEGEKKLGDGEKISLDGEKILGDGEKKIDETDTDSATNSSTRRLRSKTTVEEIMELLETRVLQASSSRYFFD